MNVGVVQGQQAFTLGNTLANQLGVDARHVGKDDELLNTRVVAHVALLCVVLFAPLIGRDAEQGHVLDISQRGINEPCL